MPSFHPRVLLLLLPLAACATGPGDSSPDPSACERLRDHVIELRLAAAGPEVDPDELARHRDALTAAAGASPADCAGFRTSAEVECQLAAADLDAYRACIHLEETP